MNTTKTYTSNGIVETSERNAESNFVSWLKDAAIMVIIAGIGLVTLFEVVIPMLTK